MMLDLRGVLVWVLKVVWEMREKKGGGKEIIWELEKHWSTQKWHDGSKIEFEKNYTRVKNIVEKIKEKYFYKS